MKLKTLRLKNYRPFKDVRTFEFRDHFTVVAGVNGRGKTAVLDALATILSRLVPQVALHAKGGYRSVADADIHHDTNETEISLSASCADYPVEVRLSRGKQDQRARMAGLSRSQQKNIQRAYGNDPQSAIDAAPIAVFYTTDRAGYRLPRRLPKVVPRGQSPAYFGALNSQRIDYTDLMARLVVSAHVENEHPLESPNYIGQQTVETMNRVLGVFLEGFGGVRVEQTPLRLIVDKATTPLAVPQLSDGERSFLAIVTDLCRRLTLANPGLEDPLYGEGVVLIDELELHLHPTWQREVVQKLRTTFPRIQFIVTTHSPFIVQSLRPGELLNLEPTECWDYSDKSIEDIAENVMGIELPQKSDRFLQMMDVAEDYYSVLQESKGRDPAHLTALKVKLDALVAPYSDDAAYVGFLNFQRRVVLRENS